MPLDLFGQLKCWQGDLQALAQRHAPWQRDHVDMALHTVEGQIRSAQRSDPVMLPQESAILAEMPRRKAKRFGYLVTTPFGIIPEANAAAERLLNFPLRWLVGQPLVVFVGRDEQRGFLRELCRLQMEGGAMSVEWLVMLQPINAQSRPIVLRAAVHRAADHHVLSLTWLLFEHGHRRRARTLAACPER